MLEWLETFSEADWRCLIVSHDRYFLDASPRARWISRSAGEDYPPYGRYLVLREERRERWRKEYEEQQATSPGRKSSSASTVRSATARRGRRNSDRLGAFLSRRSDRPRSLGAPVQRTMVLSTTKMDIGYRDDETGKRPNC